MDELRKEIDDEIALRTNYENIMMELNRLNDDVSHRTKSAVTEVSVALVSMLLLF